MNILDVVGTALRTAAEEIVASCPEHGTAEEAWALCHCEAADLVRAMGELGQGVPSA